MHQDDRDMLREAGEFVMIYDEDENWEDSIESAQAHAKERGVPLHVKLFANDGKPLGTMSGDEFMNIDVVDLDKDNYIEKSRKVNKIIVTYGDFTTEEYDSLIAAEKGITETLNGCDLATNVENIEGYVGDEHVCNYTAEMFANLTVQPTV